MIEDKGVEYLAEAIEMNHSLRLIDMKDNSGIDEKSRYKEFTRYIGLDCNGIQRFAKSLKNKTSFEAFILDNNCVDENK
jgi:hypothetical protein